jgi:hypothetical protein
MESGVMKYLQKKIVVAASLTGTVLMVGSTADASIIQFVTDDFSTHASMYAEAGEFASEIVLPTGGLSPEEDYGFGSSHSHNDGVGLSSSLVSQTYNLMEINGMPAFSLTSNAAGQFSPLNAFPFTGSVVSDIETTIAFEVTENVTIEMEATVSWDFDALPGKSAINVLLSSVRLFAEGDPTALCEWLDPADPALCAVDLVTGQKYILEFKAFGSATFNAVIDDTYSFTTDFDFLFVVMPPDEPDELECTLELEDDDDCLEAAGDTAIVTASAQGGLPPYEFSDWQFTSGDWQIIATFDDSVEVEAGTDLTATLCATVTDDIGGTSECCIELCREPDELTCMLELEGDDGCLEAEGDTAIVTASAAGGVAPYEFSDWEFTAGNWEILNTFEDSVEIQAGSDLQATLCAIVTDDAGETSECCIELCLEPDELTCMLELEGDDGCLEAEGDTAIVTASAAGGVAPYEFGDWEFTAGNWEILNTFEDSVEIQAGSDLQATLCAIVTDGAGETSECCIELCREQDPDALTCELEFNAQEECISSIGSAGTVSAIVTNGSPPFSFDWSIFGAGWELSSGQGTDQVTVIAGHAPLAELCLTVIDDEGESTECCIDLCVIPYLAVTCRAVAGGNASQDENDFTFGGQVRSPTSKQPQPQGEWTHRSSPGSEAGSWTFHAGTASAPPGTKMTFIACCDAGTCSPPPAPAKQMDFHGIGTFNNIASSNFPDGWASDESQDPTFHWFEAHIEDLSSSGSPGDHCPPEGFNCFPGDCSCPDFYRIDIYRGFYPSTIPIPVNEINKIELMHTVYAYISGGNITVLSGIGDATSSQTVGGEDLLVLLTHWSTDYIGADFNFDGTVDGVDLLILLTNWGSLLP